MANSRKQLALSLKGQKIHIPDLSPIFQSWPHRVNANVDSIRQDIEERLERYEDSKGSGVTSDIRYFSLFSNDPRLPQLKAADFSMFGSCWWPNASVERLRIVTYLSIWVNILIN